MKNRSSIHLLHTAGEQVSFFQSFQSFLAPRNNENNGSFFSMSVLERCWEILQTSPSGKDMRCQETSY